jgi:hypothetical protein
VLGQRELRGPTAAAPAQREPARAQAPGWARGAAAGHRPREPEQESAAVVLRRDLRSRVAAAAAQVAADTQVDRRGPATAEGDSIRVVEPADTAGHRRVAAEPPADTQVAHTQAEDTSGRDHIRAASDQQDRAWQEGADIRLESDTVTPADSEACFAETDQTWSYNPSLERRVSWRILSLSVRS